MDRETSFGEMLTIPFAGTEVELLKFDSEGRNHTHELWENAVCLRGSGRLVIEGEHWAFRAGEVASIQPECAHRMIPTEGPDTYDWLLWYSEQPYFNPRLP